MAQSDPPVLYSVQLLRAIAAVVVVLYHLQLAVVENLHPPSTPLETYLFSFGAVGVHMFFVISGLVMVITTYGKPFSTYRFLRRRVLRIYPIYWICAAIYVAASTLIGHDYNLSLSQLVGALLLLPPDAHRIIGPAWTLAYEMYFYIAFALAMTMSVVWRSLSQFGAMIALGMAFLCAIALGLLLSPTDPTFELVTNSLLLEFLGGIAIGLMLAKGWLPLRLGGAIVAASIALYGVSLIVGKNAAPTVLTLGAPSFLLVVGVVCVEKKHGASALLRRISTYGDSSYALYLIHMILIALLVELFAALTLGEWLQPAIVAICLAPLFVIVGELLHRRVERPLLRQINPGRSLLPPREVAAGPETSA